MVTLVIERRALPPLPPQPPPPPTLYLSHWHMRNELALQMGARWEVWSELWTSHCDGESMFAPVVAVEGLSIAHL